MAIVIDVFKCCWSTLSTNWPWESCVLNTSCSFHLSHLFPLTDIPWILPPRTLLKLKLTNHEPTSNISALFLPYSPFAYYSISSPYFQHTSSSIVLSLSIDYPHMWLCFLPNPNQTHKRITFTTFCCMCLPHPQNWINKIICYLLFLSVTQLLIAAPIHTGSPNSLLFGVLCIL